MTRIADEHLRLRDFLGMTSWVYHFWVLTVVIAMVVCLMFPFWPLSIPAATWWWPLLPFSPDGHGFTFLLVIPLVYAGDLAASLLAAVALWKVEAAKRRIRSRPRLVAATCAIVVPLAVHWALWICHVINGGRPAPF